MELISMVEFVLQQEKCLENILTEKLPVIKVASSYDKIVNYANFLKQPLKLSMFVPADENGSILQIPKHWKSFEKEESHCINRDCLNYKKAKENVLFKGVRHHDIQPSTDWNYYSLNFKTIAECSNLGKYHVIPRLHNIESLLTLSSVDKIELTESALKQIGLNP